MLMLQVNIQIFGSISINERFPHSHLRASRMILYCNICPYFFLLPLKRLCIPPPSPTFWTNLNGEYFAYSHILLILILIIATPLPPPPSVCQCIYKKIEINKHYQQQQKRKEMSWFYSMIRILILFMYFQVSVQIQSFPSTFAFSPPHPNKYLCEFRRNPISPPPFHQTTAITAAAEPEDGTQQRASKRHFPAAADTCRRFRRRWCSLST